MAHRLRLRRPGRGAEDRRRACLRLRREHRRLLALDLRADAGRRRARRRRLGHAQHDPHDRRELHGGDGWRRPPTRRRSAAPRRGCAGRDKTPQDRSIADMAVDYAAFLRQTPWYQYPFDARGRRAVGGAGRAARSRLGTAARHRHGVRGQGRLCEGHRAARSPRPAPAQLVIRSVVSRTRPAAAWPASPDVKVIGERGERHRDRNAALRPVHAHPRRHRPQGGTIREIAGNDDIMVSADRAREGAELPVAAWDRASCA